VSALKWIRREGPPAGRVSYKVPFCYNPCVVPRQMTAPSLADYASRLERELARHARLQQLILAFSREASSTDDLTPALAALSVGIDGILGGRASIWVHDRDRHELVLQSGGAGTRIPSDRLDYPAARGLRLAQPEVWRGRPSDRPNEYTLLVPLRGQRRALGVLMVEGLEDADQNDGTCALAGELSRQISSAIENKLLLSHVTRRAQVDADRRAHSQKLAALGQFVAGIAHELNNPLQSVLGHLELLRRNRRLPRRLAADIWLIYREADRAARIVSRLLVFAGARGATRRRVSPNAALARALSLRSRACRDAGIAVVRRLDEAVPRIIGDALLLQQAFLNIIVNAEHAITARRGAAPGASSAGNRIEAATRARRGVVIVEIRDTGHGIEPDVLPRIFEPFFTTKEVGQGIGLGLALTHGIIKEHGGSIAARPHPSRGTVFRIELPIPRPESPRPRLGGRHG
jgi:signal transduction histidine kinase